MRQLLTADHVLTMTPGYPAIEDGAILIENGRIEAVGPQGLRMKFCAGSAWNLSATRPGA